jgi:hypothetical protein
LSEVSHDGSREPRTARIAYLTADREVIAQFPNDVADGTRVGGDGDPATGSPAIDRLRCPPVPRDGEETTEDSTIGDTRRRRRERRRVVPSRSHKTVAPLGSTVAPGVLAGFEVSEDEQ